MHILQPVAGPVGLSGSTTTMQYFAQHVPAAIEPTASEAMIRIRYIPGVHHSKEESQHSVYNAVAQYVV